MEKIPDKNRIIAVVGEGASLSRAALELAKEHETPDVTRLATEEDTYPYVKPKEVTRKFINGVEHYLTVAGEWKPVLYSTNTKVSANE